MAFQRISSADEQQWGGDATSVPEHSAHYNHLPPYSWHSESHRHSHDLSFDRSSYAMPSNQHSHSDQHSVPVSSTVSPHSIHHQPFNDSSYISVGDDKDQSLPIKKRRHANGEEISNQQIQQHNSRMTPTSTNSGKYRTYHGVQESASTAPPYGPVRTPPEIRHDTYYYESRDDIGEYFDESRSARSCSTDRAPPPTDHHNSYEVPRQFSPEDDVSYYHRKQYSDDRYNGSNSSCTYEDRGAVTERRDDQYSAYLPDHGSDSYCRDVVNYEGNSRQLILFSLPEDKDWLSERHCFIRQNFVELFEASRNDVASRHSKGAQKLYVGQVGIRCIFCDSYPQKDRAERAVCYPSSVSRIYQTVADMQRFHFDTCRMIPEDMIKKLRGTKKTRSQCERSPQQYWIDSAKAIGLIDSQQGIRFSCPPRYSFKGAPTTTVAPLVSQWQTYPTSYTNKGGGCIDSGNVALSLPYVGSRRPQHIPCQPINSHADQNHVPPYHVSLLHHQVAHFRNSHYDGSSFINDASVQGSGDMVCIHCNERIYAQSDFATSDDMIFFHMVKCWKCPRHVKDELISYYSQRPPTQNHNACVSYGMHQNH
uniref:Uncharacterized protein n=1 Tax=Corethron hystrix TaxID=216773 RepID=A0A7S1B3G1_9STRA|mmetsp:Transcript_11364/g.24947  ORF Transcript_11364/g.24947 Transcript_11364/m.24947 type:complete len:592 (+) Transcript_11364:95-1870(+)